jgi:hypothetical protein
MTEDLPVWKWYERLERPARWDPVSVSPESYADLDLMLVFAPDERQRWQALVAGTIEVLNRFDHLTQWRANCPTAADVSEAFSRAADRMAGYGRLASAVRLAADVLDHQEECRRRDAAAIRAALPRGHDATVTAIETATSHLRWTAERMREHDFGQLPPFASVTPDHELMRAALAVLNAENARNPLRAQLAGAGGAAGYRLYNPYVAGLYELELVTHRRMYRFAYELVIHVAGHTGIDLSGETLYTPDHIDQRPF